MIFYIRPRFGVWENVPGAFSSGTPKGEDFRIVLEEFLRINLDSIYVPRPYTGRWEPSGRILLGTTFSLAWRVFDANIVLAIEEEVCYIVEQEEKQTESDSDASVDIMKKIHQSVQRIRKWWLIWKGGGRRWHTMLWETFTVKQIASMRC